MNKIFALAIIAVSTLTSGVAFADPELKVKPPTELVGQAAQDNIEA